MDAAIVGQINCCTLGLSLLGVLDRMMWDHRGNSVVDRQCIMQLQLMPKSIKLALRAKMTSRWADPRTAPSSGGLEIVCTHGF